MRWVRGLLFLVAIAAVAAAYATTRDDGGTEGASTKPVKPATDAVHVAFAYSSNLEDMFATLIPRFNAERNEVAGRPIYVDGTAASSGEVETKIVKGALKPVAWSPASSLWGRLLNFEADKAYIADRSPALASSPVVIAMWEPLARALGWPKRPIVFADILKLATTKSDWGAYGKPTFGRFRLGHTNPDFSTAGLSFVAAQYYGAAGKIEGLTLEDIQRPTIRERVRAIERSIIHYGDTGSFFAEQLHLHGPRYASAVAMEETTLIEFNRARKPGELKLVGIYPADGTFVVDNPYMVLDAPWVTAEQRRAAETFGSWLRRQMTPQLVAQFGYRPGDPAVKALPPVTRANGADPSQPRRLLSPPQPEVLAAIRAAWREDRKPANVLLVVDVSGSMADENKIEEARRGLQTFLGQLSPKDRVGLMTFESDLRTIVETDLFSRNRTLLRQRVSELVPGGSTSLYDATLAGWRAVDSLGDDERINAVVVLSDGADTNSDITLNAVLGPLQARAEGADRQIRIFTIAYGKEPNDEVLKQIAAASGGNAYSGDTKTIEAVYLKISSFF